MRRLLTWRPCLSLSLALRALSLCAPLGLFVCARVCCWWCDEGSWGTSSATAASVAAASAVVDQVWKDTSVEGYECRPLPSLLFLGRSANLCLAAYEPWVLSLPVPLPVFVAPSACPPLPVTILLFLLSLSWCVCWCVCWSVRPGARDRQFNQPAAAMLAPAAGRQACTARCRHLAGRRLAGRCRHLARLHPPGPRTPLLPGAGLRCGTWRCCHQAPS